MSAIQFYKETEFEEVELNGRVIEIPEDWEVVRLGDVAKKIKAGGTPKTSVKEYYENGTIPFVKIEDLTASGKYLIKTQLKITELGLKSSNAWIVPENSLLFAMYGSIGASAINKIPVATNQAILGIIPNSEKTDVEFLYYRLRFSVPEMRRQTKHGTQPNLTAKIVKEFKIPLPPLEEQKKIAHVLRTIDNAIEIVEKAVEKLERIKKATMEQLLTKGIVLGFMFDTNIFDKILDGEIELPQNLNYYATHIQYDEICKIPDRKRERREKLLKVFNKVLKEVIPTEGFVFGVSRFGMAKLGSDADGELYNRMLKRLKELDEKSGKQKRLENQARDVLIALTSIKNRLVLVTEDKNLKKVVEEFGGCAISFEQFIRGKYREFRDTEIGEIPKDWEVVRLGDIAKIESGGTPSRQKPEYWENGTIPWVKSGELNDGVIYDTEEKITELGLKNSSAKIFPKGTLLIALYGATVGKTGILGIDASTNQAVCAIFPASPNTFDSRFLQYNLIFLRERLIAQSSGGAQPNIYLYVLKDFKISLPPLEEQKQIAKILKTIDEAIELKKKKKEKLESMKKAVMDKLLTGKIRIK